MKKESSRGTMLVSSAVILSLVTFVAGFVSGSMVADTFTGLSNGSITPNEDILIEGDRIRINGADSSVGIFFVSEDGEKVTPVTRRLTQNDPSRIIARVPALTDGKYKLRIVTQFSKGVTLLKSPRTIEYKLPLTVGAGGGDSESPDEI